MRILNLRYIRANLSILKFIFILFHFLQFLLFLYFLQSFLFLLFTLIFNRLDPYFLYFELHSSELYNIVLL